MPNRYLKYKIPKDVIHRLLQQLNKNRLNIFIDLQSICKGLYSKDNVFFEINHYLQNRTPSDCLLMEVRTFLNDLYKEYKMFNPFFILFYDDGKNSQNSLLQKGYKDGRSSVRNILEQDEEVALYYQIKTRYFIEAEKKFKKDGFGDVYYLKEYESDLIPYYCITNNLYDSNLMSTLNLILSVDKDLLQCCQAKNTVQVTNRFLSSKENPFKIDIFDDRNAISYIYDKFKPGILGAKYIPLILAIAGDTADKITGFKGIGPKGAIDLIQGYNLPCTVGELINEKNNLPEIFKLKFGKSKTTTNFDKMISNLKIIDFAEQLKRTSILKS